jgi:hypothetical protein
MSALSRQGTVDLDPLSSADVYYGESHNKKSRIRTYSAVSHGYLRMLVVANSLAVDNTAVSQDFAWRFRPKSTN